MLTVRHSLDRASRHLLEQINNTNSRLALDAAENCIRCIEYAKHTYEEILDKTLDKVDQKIRDQIEKITGAAFAIIKQIQGEDGISLGSQIQLLGQNFFSIEKTPQVLSTSPKCVVMSSGQPNVMIEIKGHFPQIGQLPPVLIFRKTALPPLTSTMAVLTFSVPSELLFPPTSQDSLIVGMLKMHSLGRFSHPFFCIRKTEHSYPIPIGKLPPIAGRVTISHGATAITQGPTQRKVSQLYVQNSRDAGRDITQEYTVHATPGWKILNSQLDPDFSYLAGNPNYDLKSTTPTSATYEVRTKKKGGDNDITKKIRFTIAHHECQDIAIPGLVVDTPVELAWGESRTFKHPLEKSAISFEPFDGSPIRKFMKATSDDSFLIISNTSDSITITARKAEEVLLNTIVRAHMISAPPSDEPQAPAAYGKKSIIAALVGGVAVGVAGKKQGEKVVRYIISKL